MFNLVLKLFHLILPEKINTRYTHIGDKVQTLYIIVGTFLVDFLEPEGPVYHLLDKWRGRCSFYPYEKKQPAPRIYPLNMISGISSPPDF